MLKRFNKVLIICAHPDDEAIGCGGVIPLMTKKTTVDLLIFTNGEGSRNLKTKILNQKITERKLNLYKSSKNLGINNIYHLDLKDNELDSYTNLYLTKIIENYLDKIKPETIFTHHGGDLNIDHQKIYQAVITATRPYKKKSIKNIFTFEVPSSTNAYYGDKAFNPNMFIDIKSSIKKKIKSLNIYKSQFTKKPSLLNIKNITNLAKQRGCSVGCEYAEAFQIIRLIA
jgi:LmbE family N-acetylglucosaminyl deacetylase